jgi:hypothetical protein
VAPYTLRVFANIVVTSNEDHPIKIADRERRWVAIKCTEALTGNHDYFSCLHEFLDKPENQRGIYQSLMARDISHIKNMQKERPITEYYKQCRSVFSCHLSKFLSALCSLHETGMRSFKASALHQDFISFVERARLGGKAWSVTEFGNKMQAYVGVAVGAGTGGDSGVSKMKSGGCMHYSIDVGVLREHLLQKGRFDEDAELQEAGHDFAAPRDKDA